MPSQVDYIPLPLLLPWVDLTPLRGGTALNASIPSNAGVYLSLLHLAGFERGDIVADVEFESVSYGLGGLDMLEKRSSSSSYPYISYVSAVTCPTSFGDNPETLNVDNTYEMKSLAPIPRETVPIKDIDITVRKYTAQSSSSYVSYQKGAPGWATYNRKEDGYTSSGFRLLQSNGAEQGNSLGTSIAWFSQNKPLLALPYASGSLTLEDEQKLPIFRANPAKRGSPMQLVGYQPSRPLASPPTLIERCTAVDHVTIGGRSYHMQHSRRKTWQVELLLDGASDGGLISDGKQDGILDPLTTWDTFLKWAEVGVTLWIDRALGPGAFTRPRCYPYLPGMPNRIAGQLLDASQLRLAYDDGIARRYRVTLVIAEEVPY